MKLKELKKLCDEATPGPHFTIGEIVRFENGGYSFRLADAEFIAAARTALPKLIAVAEFLDRLVTANCIEGTSNYTEAARLISDLEGGC